MLNYKRDSLIYLDPVRTAGIGVLILSLLVLAALAQYNYVVFHTVVELYTAIVAILAAIVGWHTYPFTRNNYLSYLASGYFWVAIVDFVHTLDYRGVAILMNDDGSARATQFWLVARYLEAFLLATATMFLHLRLRREIPSLVFGLFVVGSLLLIFQGYFPKAFVPGEGLTDFKIVSEYIIIFLFFVALITHYKNRSKLASRLFKLISLAIIFSIFGEFSFTLYADVYALPNMVGHLFKFASYWMIYAAIIHTALSEPFRLLARGASTYDAIPDPTVLLDEKGVIRDMNRAAVNYLGMLRRDSVGKHCHTLFHSSNVPREHCVVCQAIEEGVDGSQSFEMELHESAQWSDITLSPVLSDRDVPMGVVHVVRDVTRRKRAEFQLRSRHEEISSIIESVGEGVFGMDDHGRATFVNPALERMTGWSAEELLGKNTHQLLHHHRADGSVYPSEQCPVHRTILNGEVNREDGDLFWRKDGSSFEVEFTSSPLHGKNGEITGAVVVFRDISRRKAAERALAQSENRYRTIMENASDGILIVNESGRVIDANLRMEEMVARTIEELSDLPIKDLHPETEWDLLTSSFDEMDRSGSVSGEFHLVRKDGSQLPVEVVGTRLEYNDRPVYFGSFRDISHRRRIEDERRRYRVELEKMVATRTQELEELNRELESFSYSVSHDLRGPLRAVNGFAHALEEDYGEELNDEAKDYLSRISLATKRMSQLIDGLLVLSRVLRREIQIQELDLGEIAREIANELSATSPERNVEWRIADELNISADPFMIRLLMQNLLDNAWKFTANKEKAIIEVGKQIDKNGHWFYVKDNGAGFEMQYSTNLFQPFHRLHDNKEFSGTGIGLATVQRIVRRHGGGCRAEGAVNQGATIYFTLPEIGSKE